MSRDTINRRGILKGIGSAAAAAGGGVSFSSSVAARNPQTEAFLQDAISAEKTDRIEAELGDVSVEEADRVVLEHSVERSGNVVIRQALFFLPAGTLMYSETGGGASEALFKFGMDRGVLSKFTAQGDANDEIGLDWQLSGASGTTETRSQSRRHGRGAPDGQVRAKYRSLPDDTHPMVIASDEGAVFRRTATERERQIVSQSVDIDVTDDVDVITGSDVEGFTVTEYEDGAAQGADGDSAQRNITNVLTSAGEFTPFEAVGQTLSAQDMTHTETETVSAASHEVPECAGLCTGCAAAITGCALCTPACANPVGPLTCPICLFPVCHGVLLAACTFCAECLDNHHF